MTPLVLLTRPRAQSEAMLGAVKARGWEALVWPLKAIEPPSNPAPAEAALRDLQPGDTLFFGSANAAEGWVGKAKRLGIAPFSKGVEVWCVGGATARALAAHGCQPTLIPEQANSEGVWDQALREGRLDPPRRMILPRGEHGREWLGEQLTARGWQVLPVAVYRVVDVRPDMGALERVLSPGRPVAALLFQASAVAPAVEALSAVAVPVCWGALSEPVARALRERGIEPFQGADHRADALLDALMQCQGFGPSPH
ncbi:MAG: hypothetical protein AUJ55_11125 [Proteobacteria bacterium CG1_02_64_396]|nr:MAG: hypothetical protein AUJ55_11125 [Proteobacteria bacterium CG1_02_64_396]